MEKERTYSPTEAKWQVDKAYSIIKSESQFGFHQLSRTEGEATDEERSGVGLLSV